MSKPEAAAVVNTKETRKIPDLYDLLDLREVRDFLVPQEKRTSVEAKSRVHPRDTEVSKTPEVMPIHKTDEIGQTEKGARVSIKVGGILTGLGVAFLHTSGVMFGAVLVGAGVVFTLPAAIFIGLMALVRDLRKFI